jgi:hypothetical protein
VVLVAMEGVEIEQHGHDTKQIEQVDKYTEETKLLEKRDGGADRHNNKNAAKVAIVLLNNQR